MKINSVESLMRAYKRETLAAIVRAENHSAEIGKDLAIKFSMGVFQQAQFNKSLKAGGLAHPYAQNDPTSAGPRGAVPYGNFAVINKQKSGPNAGLFARSWKVSYFVQPGGRKIPVIYNTDPIAEFLQRGTVFMKARPLDVQIMVFLDRIRFKNILKEAARVPIDVSLGSLPAPKFPIRPS